MRQTHLTLTNGKSTLPLQFTELSTHKYILTYIYIELAVQHTTIYTYVKLKQNVSETILTFYICNVLWYFFFYCILFYLYFNFFEILLRTN